MICNKKRNRHEIYNCPPERALGERAMHGLALVCSAVLCSLTAATITCSSGWGERTKKQALEYTHAAFCANTSTCFEVSMLVFMDLLRLM
jgi:Na+/alanine symporter